ncbi:hypothetical protein BC937DRAFT_86890, partial [Endogone sp. FLAS-F59071]
MPKAVEYFKDLAYVLFNDRKDILKEILEYGNKINDLKTAVTRMLKSHQAKGMCLLILDYAESLKYMMDKDSDAVTLWNWLYKTAAAISGVVVLATSTEYLGWEGESWQELKGIVDDENIQPAAKLFCQWMEPRKQNEMDQEPKKDELLWELIKAVNGNPKSLEELGKKFGSSIYSSKSLVDLVADLNLYGYQHVILFQYSTDSIKYIPLLLPQSEVTTWQNEVFLVPYLQNFNFVDCPSVFEKLYYIVKKNKEGIACKPISLCGLGGMGKTEIAIEFCYQNIANY